MNKWIRFAFLAITLSIFSCSQQNNNKDKEEDSVEKFVWDEWKDSVYFSEESSTMVELKCNHPAGGTVVNDSINKWICRELGDNSYTYLENLSMLVYKAGRNQFVNDSTELAKINRDADIGYPVSTEYYTEFNKEYEDSIYVTMRRITYVYLGGAHGSNHCKYVTFRKSDGHIMGWDLLSDMTNGEIIAQIKLELCKHLEIDDVDELEDYLLLNPSSEEGGITETFRKHFPLPVTPPFLLKDGVAVIYQEYEITPYADGSPTCIVKRL